MKKQYLATIDITSYGIYMRIYEKNEIKGFKIIEKLDYETIIGRDIYSTKEITFQKIKEIVEAIDKMKEIIKAYKIRKVILYGTTAVREAENWEYLEDQIKIKTNLNLKIYDRLEENYLVYKQIDHLLEKDKNYSSKTNMILYVGLGSIGVAIVRKGHFIYSSNISLGSLKLIEMAEITSIKSKYKNEFFDDYTANLFENIIEDFPEGIDIENIIITGRFYDLIIEKIKEKEKIELVEKIDRKDLWKYYNKVKDLSIEEFSDEYNVREEKGEVIFPKIMVLKKFSDIFKKDDIVYVDFSLSDSIAYDYFYPLEAKKINMEFHEDTIIISKERAKRFNYNDKKIRKTENIIEQIFNELKESHGLTKQELLYLKIANIFKETGKYIKSYDYYDYSYKIFETVELLGLCKEDVKIISEILKYYDKNLKRLYSRSNLTKENKLIVSKLILIIKIANGLIINKKNRVKDVIVELENNQLTLKVITDEKIYNEKLEIELQKENFENTFGIKLSMKEINN